MSSQPSQPREEAMTDAAPAGAPSGSGDSVAGLEYVIARTTAILEKLGSIDLSHYESLPAAIALDKLEEGPVAATVACLADTLRVLTTLPFVVGETGAPEPGTSDDELDLDFDLTPAAEPNEGDARPPAERVGAEIDAALARITVADQSDDDPGELDGLCRMLIQAVRASREQLQRARHERAKWSLIAAAEESRRKCQRALRAAVCAAAQVLGVDPATLVFAHEHSELASALRVREALMRFRTEVLDLTASVGEANAADMIVSARACGECINVLSHRPAYGELRALDRYTLQQVRTRLEAFVAAGGADVEGGRQALLDLNAFADLLRAVNNRETLVQHDRAKIRELIDALEACLATANIDPSRARRDYAPVLARFAALRWRDVALDAEVLRQVTDGAQTALEPSIYALLGALNSVRL